MSLECQFAVKSDEHIELTRGQRATAPHMSLLTAQCEGEGGPPLPRCTSCQPKVKGRAAHRRPSAPRICGGRAGHRSPMPGWVSRQPWSILLARSWWAPGMCLPRAQNGDQKRLGQVRYKALNPSCHPLQPGRAMLVSNSPGPPAGSPCLSGHHGWGSLWGKSSHHNTQLKSPTRPRARQGRHERYVLQAQKVRLTLPPTLSPVPLSSTRDVCTFAKER